MGAIAGGRVDDYVKREGTLIYMRPTQYGTGFSTASSWTNPMTAAEARKVAKRLTELADESERPDYKPGKTYRSPWGNRFVRTADRRWLTVAGGLTFDDGEIVDDASVSHPLTEVAK